MDEATSDNGVGDVPVFADQQGVFIQRGRAAVGEIVAELGAGADDGELAFPTVGEFVGFAFEAKTILKEEGVDSFLGELGMVGRHAPVDVGVAFGIYGDGSG